MLSMAWIVLPTMLFCALGFAISLRCRVKVKSEQLAALEAWLDYVLESEKHIGHERVYFYRESCDRRVEFLRSGREWRYRYEPYGAYDTTDRAGLLAILIALRPIRDLEGYRQGTTEAIKRLQNIAIMVNILLLVVWTPIQYHICSVVCVK